jgi:hypothetical protein
LGLLGQARFVIVESYVAAPGAATYDTDLAPAGRPDNPCHGEISQRTLVDLMRERYADFGPTLAAESLLKPMAYVFALRRRGSG